MREVKEFQAPFEALTKASPCPAPLDCPVARLFNAESNIVFMFSFLCSSYLPAAMTTNKKNVDR